MPIVLPSNLFGGLRDETTHGRRVVLLIHAIRLDILS
jgi:hypothetical protein